MTIKDYDQLMTAVSLSFCHITSHSS